MVWHVLYLHQLQRRGSSISAFNNNIGWWLLPSPCIHTTLPVYVPPGGNLSMVVNSLADRLGVVRGGERMRWECICMMWGVYEVGVYEVGSVWGREGMMWGVYEVGVYEVGVYEVGRVWGGRVWCGECMRWECMRWEVYEAGRVWLMWWRVYDMGSVWGGSVWCGECMRWEVYEAGRV